MTALERIAAALERLADAEEQAVLNKMAGPVGPEPPPYPSAEFRQSRDLPPTPFLPMEWKCPIHHASKVIEAGVSRKSGKPYNAFIACAEQGCDQKPPR